MFYFQTRSTSSSKSGGLSASFAAPGIRNSAQSVWHAAPGYAKFNWNWELKIPCSNELRGALKFLYSSSLQPGQRALTILPLSCLLQHERNKHFPCPKIQPKSHLGGKKLKAELQNKIITRCLTLSAGNKQMVTYQCAKMKRSFAYKGIYWGIFFFAYAQKSDRQRR